MLQIVHRSEGRLKPNQEKVLDRFIVFMIEHIHLVDVFFMFQSTHMCTFE